MRAQSHHRIAIHLIQLVRFIPANKLAAIAEYVETDVETVPNPILGCQLELVLGDARNAVAAANADLAIVIGKIMVRTQGLKVSLESGIHKAIGEHPF